MLYAPAMLITTLPLVVLGAALLGGPAATAQGSARELSAPRPGCCASDRHRSSDPPPGVEVGSRQPHAKFHSEQGGADHQCVSPELSAWVREQATRNRALLGLAAAPVAQAGEGEGPAFASGGVASDQAPYYLFYPMAGNIGADVMNGGFVDLDAAPGAFHDFACRPFTYDGHAGTDTGIRSFGEQFIGIPVFAARDGVVVFAQDGWPDTNVNGGVQGNIVAIDHGLVNGAHLESQYYHLKKDSVAVSVGQQVKAGQQIGKVGSSGNSFGPHLHFQTMIDGQVAEPFAGPCGSADSGWSNQAPLDTEELFLHDFGITRTDLFSLPQPWWEPWPLPTHAQIQLDDPAVVFWWFVYNFPQDCPIRVRFYRPDSSLAWDAQWNWGNTELWRTHKNWFAFDLQWMGPVVGTWRLLFELDGKVMMDTPFEVVASVNPGFNRPPAAIAASFDPAAPAAADVVFCRVGTTVGKEDPDWDIVRYRYVWKVNGAVVRDVTTAAQSDAIPRNTAPAGATLLCTVTPSDGKVDGASASVSVVVAGGIFADLNGDGVVGGADLGLLLGAWGACAGCAADLNGNGEVDGADLGLLLGAWT